GTTDQVDLNVSVIEKPTGNVLLGAGFGSGEGLILSGSVTKNNIFGSGKHISAQVNSSKINTVYALSYTDPYYTIDGISRGFDVYTRKLDAVDSGLGQYRTKTVGGAMRFGVPVTEIDTIQYGLGYETTKIDIFDDSPLFYKNYVNSFGSRNSTVTGTVGWIRDGRDSLIYPTMGAMNKAILETGLPGGTLKYYKTTYQHQRYLPLTRNYTLMLNGEIGYGSGYGDKPLPFFKNYYVGGVNSVRGYKTFTIGPKDESGNPQGGSHKLLANAEVLFPFPGLEKDKSVRVGAFVDGGMVANTYDAGEMRYSTGLSVLWVSPFGPLKISMAKPLNAKTGDSSQVFQFTFGGAF
ncbi:MAG: outer membrane protein assembly factor BamA, partial [Burkholderiales bacterium]|nr:outer membrane protein assembly factor BamA [Burkholderiales bacterium]